MLAVTLDVDRLKSIKKVNLIEILYNCTARIRHEVDNRLAKTQAAFRKLYRPGKWRYISPTGTYDVGRCFA